MKNINIQELKKLKQIISKLNESQMQEYNAPKVKSEPQQKKVLLDLSRHEQVPKFHV